MMETKHFIDFSKQHNLKTLFAGVILGMLGILIIMAIDSLWWLGELSPGQLILYLFLTLIPGIYIHEGYHRLMARILGHYNKDSRSHWSEFPALEGLRKWEALGIKLAPSLDLSLVAALIILFLPSSLNPFLSIFLVGNLAGSGSDYIQSYYIFKLATPNSVIRFTSTGLEIKQGVTAE